MPRGSTLPTTRTATEKKDASAGAAGSFTSPHASRLLSRTPHVHLPHNGLFPCLPPARLALRKGRPMFRAAPAETMRRYAPHVPESGASS